MRGERGTGLVEGVERLVGLGGRGWGGRGDWRKFKDSPFLALHLFSLLALLIFLPFTLLFHPSLPPSTSPSLPSPPPTASPFRTLLHTIPLLSLLLLLVTAIPPLFMLALRKAVRVVIIGTGVVVVSGLMGGSWWLFLGSFEEVGEGEVRNWWGGTGLRIISIFPFLAAILSARVIWSRRAKLARTVGVVELAIDVLLTHPPLLVLTPALLAVFSVASVPFLVVIMRLLLLGYYESPPEGTWIYHLKPKATPLILLVVGLWIWMWGVFRGIGRVTIAGVVGEWYFHRDDPALPSATTSNLKQTDPFGLGFEIETTRIAFNRATGPSLGSICLSALIMAVLRAVREVAYSLKKATSPSTISSLPEFFHPLNILEPIFGIVASILDQLNGYALVYVGITGEAFFPSARAVAGLVARRNRGSGRKLLDYTLIKLLLRLFSLTISLLTATIGYLFATHALLAPWHAPLAGLLCGGTVWFSIRFSMDGLINAADALFICYAIDVENGGTHCTKAGEAVRSLSSSLSFLVPLPHLSSPFLLLLNILN
ncbi:plasma-membrane choline transporter-domain-containing protein [Mrakia frigida]|uniref:choline transporter-like family protein n=1 Tax=Mrakia frigida TaxID=29902 RepID=UPI003FCC25B3